MTGESDFKKVDTEVAHADDQGFKKSATTVTPSAAKKPIGDVNDQLMHDAPVHGSNVLDQGHDVKDGEAHDRKHKHPEPATGK